MVYGPVKDLGLTVDTGDEYKCPVGDTRKPVGSKILSLHRVQSVCRCRPPQCVQRGDNRSFDVDVDGVDGYGGKSSGVAYCDVPESDSSLSTSIGLCRVPLGEGKGVGGRLDASDGCDEGIRDCVRR